MDTPQTEYRKGVHGWTAETSIEMGDAVDSFDRPAKRYLQITTMKRSNGGLYTTARAALKRDGIVTFAIFGEFSKTIATSGERCTEKAVRRLHENALTQVETVLAEARAFYAAKDEQKRMRDVVKDEIARGAAPALATNQTVRELSGGA